MNNSENPSKCFRMLSEKPYQVGYGHQVRQLFLEDLNCISSGVCLLPEWICYSMTEAAHQSHHRVIFYPVNRMIHSKVPLETNWESLIDLIKNNSHQEIIILTAFPLGYIDQGIQHLYTFLKEREVRVHLFLDLSQSYGSYSFIDDLDQVKAIYLSFNGRKLINSGGALRISKSSFFSSFIPMDNLQKRVDAALSEQKKNWEETWSEIIKYLNTEDLIEKIQHFNRTSYRSSYYRTALTYPVLSEASQWLIQEGFAQTVHPHPQNTLKMSSAYEEWKENMILLFSQKRALLYNSPPISV